MFFLCKIILYWQTKEIPLVLVFMYTSILMFICLFLIFSSMYFAAVCCQINHSPMITSEDSAWEIKGKGLFSWEQMFTLRAAAPVRAGEQLRFLFVISLSALLCHLRDFFESGWYLSLVRLKYCNKRVKGQSYHQDKMVGCTDVLHYSLTLITSYHPKAVLTRHWFSSVFSVLVNGKPVLLLSPDTQIDCRNFAASEIKRGELVVSL